MKKVKLQENFFKIWSPFLLVTSVVLTPIKGTTPAFILGFLSILVLLNSKFKNKVLFKLILFLFIYASIYFISQFILINFHFVNFENVLLVHPFDKKPYLRSSHFTQSLYLIPGLFTFFYFKYFFKMEYLKYVKIACLVLVFYGFYEWIYYFVFHRNGDFLTNRTFGDGESGSLFQVIYISGLKFMRLKSLTGEPSMYAFSMIPFFILFNELKDKKMTILIFVSLILSTSSSAILGLLIYFSLKIFIVFKNGVKKRHLISFFKILPIVIFAFIKIFAIIEEYYFMIIDKVTLKHMSGVIRFSHFNNHIEYWKSLSLGSKLVGVGFGTIRSTEMFTTLLVNVGLIGVFLYSLIFIYPIFVLKKTSFNKGVCYGLITLYLISMISVSEFSYMSIWIMLGLAYSSNKEFKSEYEFSNRNAINC